MTGPALTIDALPGEEAGWCADAPRHRSGAIARRFAQAYGYAFKLWTLGQAHGVLAEPCLKGCGFSVFPNDMKVCVPISGVVCSGNLAFRIFFMRVGRHMPLQMLQLPRTRRESGALR